ncbi:hypothetical protein CW745_13545 [Psychromonas sp. psych-6C06]|uniref:DUF2189 domain-containing protein n=1 Tax=Psychromonas sp. psych-6C06 TaxID=2058089 RepID=UPI000C33C62A|nr:DUF2189 domain-containing protein [Psychromonas sp. psych-6C06]PKF60893.1 hypothetical protein CW745_13545 [Psychromonas sp. psych-6C06]
MPTTQTFSHPSSEYARTIACHKLKVAAPFHWLSLAIKDFLSSPFISIGYGILFSIIPYAALQLLSAEASPMFIIPMVVAFTLIGPVFASALYDVAWEIEKGHKPSFNHSVKALLRNQISLWAFAVILLLIMIAWVRLASLVFVLFPTAANASLMDMAVFLGVGSLIGGVLSMTVLVISAFTPQIIMERRVDIMTAIFTSANAVKNNLLVMCIWGAIIIASVAIGFLTSGIAFVAIMPMLSFASWHAYIATVKTKKQRTFE